MASFSLDQCFITFDHQKGLLIGLIVTKIYNIRNNIRNCVCQVLYTNYVTILSIPQSYNGTSS